MIFKSQNEHIYLLVRANVLSAVKGSYFIDSPNHIVRKIDRMYCQQHTLDHELFLENLKALLDQMKADFTYEIGEYDRINASIENLKKFITHKLNGEID